MAYRVDRYDFVEGTHPCHFCHRQVTIGMAHIVKDDEANEFVSGPSCAKNSSRDNVINPKEKVPNFTKGIFKESSPTTSGPLGGTGGLGTPNGNADEGDDGASALLEDKALEYLRLRIEKLKIQGFRGADHSTLATYYQEWQSTGSLSENTRNRLINISSSQKCKNERFHLERLLKCYATATYLTRLLAHETEIRAIDTVKGIQRSLLTNYHLTDFQIKTIESIGKAMQDPIIASLRLASFGPAPVDPAKIKASN